MLREKLFALTFATIILVAASTQAAVAGLISYQGRITTLSGIAVADGAYLIKFQIYDSAVGGVVLWNSNYQSVQVKDGVYTYLLGQDVPFPSGLFAGGNRWLGITIGVDPEMTPRKQMTATGYAFVSQNADSVQWSGIKNIPVGFADGVDNNSGGDITAVNTTGGLTGGAASGDANLSIATGGVTSSHIGDGQIVNADVNAAASIAAAKIAGTAATLSGSQTFTGKNSFADSVIFSDSTMQLGDGRVKIGSAADPIFQNVLTVARNYLSDEVNSRGGILVDIDNGGTSPTNAGTFLVRSTTGNVSAIVTQARTDAYFRRGAYVEAYPVTFGLSTGISYGLEGVATDGAACYAVHGTATRGDEVTGVYGSARLARQSGYGIFGRASDNPVNGIGVYGGATANGVGVGVYGEAWANSVINWAGYVGGDVNVTGTVYMPAKVSRIDHPLDPENQYLQYADVVSPDMLNIYTGNVTTDSDGEAVVVLPDYFAAVNSDFRYQLTVIGQFAQAIIAETISNNRFTIKTDKPNVAVSWQVTGIRQDPFARSNRVPVEVAKSPREVGKYQNPEAYGLSSDRGVTADLRAAALKAAAANLEPPRAIDAEKRR